MAVSDQDLIVASSAVAVCEVDGGAAILDLDRNVYFSLNRTGAVVWASLQKPVSIDDLCSAVAEQFEVSKDACRADVRVLVDQLMSSRLARVADASAG